MLSGRRAIIAAGIVLIALGIGALIGSYALAHGPHALAQGWWEGTLQALGVGFIVGGLVDVLAISGLDQIARADDLRRKQLKELNDRARSVLRAQYKDEKSRSDAIHAFNWENLDHLTELDPDVNKDMRVTEWLLLLKGLLDAQHGS